MTLRLFLYQFLRTHTDLSTHTDLDLSISWLLELGPGDYKLTSGGKEGGKKEGGKRGRRKRKRREEGKEGKDGSSTSPNNHHKWSHVPDHWSWWITALHFITCCSKSICTCAIASTIVAQWMRYDWLLLFICHEDGIHCCVSYFSWLNQLFKW